MPNYINIGGKLCVSTKEYGYITVEEYKAILEIEKHKEKQVITNSEEINANCTLISQINPTFLSKDEVLDVFVNYVHKYRNTYDMFDIPVGIKYKPYMYNIYQKLRYAFPDIQWIIKRETATTIICRGIKI